MSLEIFRYKFVGGDFSTIHMEVPSPVALVAYNSPVVQSVDVSAEDSVRVDLDCYMRVRGYEFDAIVTPP
jgi:hypothetical protein